MATPPEVDQDQNIYVNFDSKGPYLSIPQFYAGRSVFITGGTGFMGKVSLLPTKTVRYSLSIRSKNSIVWLFGWFFFFVFAGVS